MEKDINIVKEEDGKIEETITEEPIIFKNELKKIFEPKLSTFIFVLPLFIASIYFAIFQTENIYQMISLITFSIFLSFASIQDFREKMVLEIWLLLSGFSSIFYIKNSSFIENDLISIGKSIGINILLGLGLLIFMWVLAKTLSFVLKKQAMGEGDYPIFFAMIIFCGFLTSYTLIIMAVTAIMYKVIIREETIPLIPFMQLGIIIVLFIEKFNILGM